MAADIERLRRLDGLHGATIEEIVWCKADHSLRLTYGGSVSGRVSFIGVDGCAVETALLRGAFRIAGIDVEQRAGSLEARIGFSTPDAELRFVCRDLTVTIIAS